MHATRVTVRNLTDSAEICGLRALVV